MKTWTLKSASILIFLATTSSPALAQRDLKNIPDPDPEVERKSFQVAPGFEVSLYAADPLLAKPIQMNFDAKGRLWVASSEIYPQITPGQAANDKILILEDKDGDGKADSTTIFADGLLIPTGVEPGDGGAYVANSTEIVFLKDTNGDGKADHRRVMLSGFGTEDTHHILHTFRWGEDGMLYFNQSIYIHSHIETPWGPRRLNGGGIWQFRPETMKLDVFARGWVNAWGHHTDAWGSSFATDGAGGEGINFIVPGAYYTTAPDAVRILPGLNPGSPKYCGLEIVSGRHLPDDWQGNLLTNDFRANRVCRFVVSDDGSGFASKEMTEVIKTTHGAFRPIDVKMGPDGAIYIADWYNPIIQHGEVDFRDPRRDHTHGRIWRVTAKDRPLVEKPKLEGASVEQLLVALKAPEGYTRHFAKRVLKERGAKDVIPKLAEWVKTLDPNDRDFEHHRLEALWTYQSLDVPDPALLAGLIKSPEYRVRAAASRVVPHWQNRDSGALEMLGTAASDANPRVRLEAVRALGKVPDPQSVVAATMTWSQKVKSDRFLDYALWLTARELKDLWVPAMETGKLKPSFEGRYNPDWMTLAMTAVGSPAVAGRLLGSLRSGEMDADREAAAVDVVAGVGGPNEAGQTLDIILDEKRSSERRSMLLNRLRAGLSTRNIIPSGDLARMRPMLDANADPVLRRDAIAAAGAWKAEAVRGSLLEAAESRDGLTRRVALVALASLGDATSRAFLLKLASEGQPSDRLLAASLVMQFNAQDGARRLVEALAANPPAAMIEESIGAILQIRNAPASLVDALKDKTLPPDVAKVAVRTVRSLGREEAALLESLGRAGSISTGPVLLSESEMAKMVSDVSVMGDAARGEAIFRNPAMQCLNCHAIAGAGGQVGPGLESIGASAPVDYLIDSILQPNKAIKEGYHSLTVATNDGRIQTGIKVRDNDREVVLRDASGMEITIPPGSIEEKKEAGSLMPVGLTETLTRQELLDLVRFLSQLGKVGPYSVGKARVVRRWQISGDPSDDRRGKSDPSTWTAVYSQVNGKLPKRDLANAIVEAQGMKTQVGARFQINVTTPGKIRLRVDPSEVVGLWLDQLSMPKVGVVDLDLTAGIHNITLRIDPSNVPTDLQCELEDVPGSPARAQLVVGK